MSGLFGGFKKTECLECQKDPPDDPVEILPHVLYVCQGCLNKLLSNVKGTVTGRLQQFFDKQPWAKPVVEAFIRGLQDKPRSKVAGK